MVVLENIGRQPLTLLLTHDAACTELRCFCGRHKQVETHHDPETGQSGHRVRRARMPRAITLFAKGREGSTSQPLPESVKRAPDVAKAIRAGTLRANDVAEVAPETLMPADQAAEIEASLEQPLVEEPKPAEEPKAEPAPEPAEAPVEIPNETRRARRGG